MSDARGTAGVTTDAPPNHGASGRRARLLVYRPANPEVRSRIIELYDGVEVSFGRSRTCSVYIDSEEVSRRHAFVIRRGDQVFIEDLGSRNGSRVNGDRIEAPCLLRSGDEIAIGPVTATVSLTTSVASGPTVGGASLLEERLAAETDRCLRYRRPFTLIMIRLDGGLEAVDASKRLSADLRTMDLLVEYGPEELAVLIPEADRTAGERVARRLLRVLERGGARAAKLGLAAFPVHGSRAGRLLSSARAALRVARRRGLDLVVAAEQSPEPIADIIAVDPGMRRTLELADRVAGYSMTVLITGETGAGKEVVAEAIHRGGDRREHPLLRVNCASIPESLLESALFGHEPGAFTGADRRRAGYFEASDGGTLFLDEIGELSPALQAKLLRVLESCSFSRVGGTREIQVDVRVLCATNRDLEAEVKRGRFREDLFYRISAFTLMVPPLRDRPADLLPLAQHFIRQAAGELGVPAPTVARSALAVMKRYRWPGNVRELRNAMERAVVLQTSGAIEAADLPERMTEPGEPRSEAAAAGPGTDLRSRVAAFERAALIEAIEACGGNQTHAARRLGLSRRAFIYKLERHGLKPRPPR